MGFRLSVLWHLRARLCFPVSVRHAMVPVSHTNVNGSALVNKKKASDFFDLRCVAPFIISHPFQPPLIHVFSHPINGLAIFCLMHHPWIYVSSLLLLFFFTYKHLFDFVPLPLYCIIFSQFVFAIIYILTVIGYEHTHSVRLFALFSLLMHFV